MLRNNTFYPKANLQSDQTIPKRQTKLKNFNLLLKKYKKST